MLHLYKNKIAINHDEIPDLLSVKKLLTTLKEEDATKVLMYMYLLINRSDENPIREFPIGERTRRAKLIAFGETTETIMSLYPDHTKLISQMFKEYEVLVVDKIQKNIDLYDKKMYQFIQLLSDNEPEIIKNTHEISDRVTFSTNIDIITAVLENSVDIILDKAALILMKKTGKFSNDLRGCLSPNIKGQLKN
jgi:hypothetical protein